MNIKIKKINENDFEIDWGSGITLVNSRELIFQIIDYFNIDFPELKELELREEGWILMRDFTKMTGKSRQTLYNMIKKNKIPVMIYNGKKYVKLN